MNNKRPLFEKMKWPKNSLDKEFNEHLRLKFQLIKKLMDSEAKHNLRLNKANTTTATLLPKP